MAIERTLSIIKPDAVAKNVIGKIYDRFESAGLQIIASRMAHLSQSEAEQFYSVHQDRPFFKDLVSFMISGPVMIQVLQGEGAIAKNRDLMGATDPKKAAKEEEKLLKKVSLPFPHDFCFVFCLACAFLVCLGFLSE